VNDAILFLEVPDVARAMHKSRSRVYQLIRAGHLPAVRVGGSIKIPLGAWHAWQAGLTAAALAHAGHREVDWRGAAQSDGVVALPMSCAGPV
jgi:excisionase family DNA binding protein